MPLLEFETCRQRIYRAKTHSEAFAKFWSGIEPDELYSTIISVDSDGAGGIWIEPRLESLPETLALELGEFLYQLRGALDACVYAAAILESGHDPPPDEKNLEFPICDSPDDFKKAGWKIRPLTKKRRDIIEAVQPYNAPALEPELRVRNIHRTLAILNDWARKDRHRKLHLVGSWASHASPKLRVPSGVQIVSLSASGDGFLEHQSKVTSFQLADWHPDMRIQGNPDVVIDVAVDEIPPPCADNDTLGERVTSMIIWVKGIVNAVEQSFLDEQQARTRLDPWRSS